MRHVMWQSIFLVIEASLSSGALKAVVYEWIHTIHSQIDTRIQAQLTPVLHTYCRIMSFIISAIYYQVQFLISDIVTLWQNNLTGISLKLHKSVLQSAHKLQLKWCLCGSQEKLCSKYFLWPLHGGNSQRLLHLKYISVQTSFDCCERAAVHTQIHFSP